MSASLSSANASSQPHVAIDGKAFRLLFVDSHFALWRIHSDRKTSSANMDYIAYWSAGQLLRHHSDPYSPVGVFALEKAMGFLPGIPLIMRNPPWALFLVAPLGLVSGRLGLFLWILLAAACILVSIHLLNPRSKDNSLALLFAPAIACFGSGQSSPFLLLGFALFLRFDRSRPFLAGASLLLMAIKPHLFLIFWAVLLIDSIQRRKFAVLAGAASAVASATIFAMCFDAHIWSRYSAMLRSSALDREVFPTVSMLLRVLIDAHVNWLLFISSTVAVLWGIWFYVSNSNEWDWTTHGMLLMLVTVLASPYGWFTDEIVLLPSIMFAFNFPAKRRYSGWILLSINGAAAIVYTAAGARLESPVLIWTPLAWFAWFLYATWGPPQFDRPQHSAIALEDANA